MAVDKVLFDWALNAILDSAKAAGKDVAKRTFAVAETTKALPSETWYCDKDVCPPTVTGEPGWLIWCWNGSAADYPGYVAQVGSYADAEFIVAAHNALVVAPPDMKPDDVPDRPF